MLMADEKKVETETTEKKTDEKGETETPEEKKTDEIEGSDEETEESEEGKKEPSQDWKKVAQEWLYPATTASCSAKRNFETCRSPPRFGEG